MVGGELGCLSCFRCCFPFEEPTSYSAYSSINRSPMAPLGASPMAAAAAIVLILSSMSPRHSLSHSPAAPALAPLSCSDATRVCTSFIAFKPRRNSNLQLALSMFDVMPEDITADDVGSPGYLFIRKNCSCSATPKRYLSNTTFTLPAAGAGDGVPVAAAVAAAYGALAVLPNATKRAKAGGVVQLRLLCGCSDGLWNYLMSYEVEGGDSVQSLSSRFGVSMDAIETVNRLDGPSRASVAAGDVYYIPMNSVPGQPYSVNTTTAAANSTVTSPAPAVAALNVSDYHTGRRRSGSFPYGWVIGGVGVSLFLVVGALLSCISCSLLGCCGRRKDSDHPASHKFHILRTASLCSRSGRALCCKSGTKSVDNSNNQMSIPRGMVSGTLDMEKPIVFAYEEILSSTDSFSDSNLLGHGTYGSVYYGVLRDQEVVVKRMTATKSNEFMAEMKILCKVHHASLVELIGYAASNDELFLVYEYAQKGTLKNHLHDPLSKGYTSLSWISRVQIALDVARGLEYIHEHTKDHYVHRDIKTSNILLDGTFRAKISDFGLAKLVVRTDDEEASASKVVGTFGYLAPEYMHDGLATTKSDVYAFGVVLFELISGKEAITRTDGMILANSERRSLASIMLAAMKNSPNSTSMASLRECIDPNLTGLYPHDCVFKVAMLAKQCVDEDPAIRPDMKQTVISLSHILLSSVEWEAALAGNSQVFSGLVQGR